MQELLPEWLFSGLAFLRQKFPEDQFHGTFNAEGAARVSCADCPGTLYVVDNSNVSKFEPHLRNKKHRENVTSRVRRSSMARSPICPPPPTFKEQLRFEKLKRPSTPTSNSFGRTEAFTPILPPEGKLTPILPSAITHTQGLSPTVRITALENSNTEKDGKIKALEQRLGWMEEEQKRQGELLAEIFGRKENSDDGPSQRSEAGASTNGTLSRQGSRTDSTAAAPLKSTLRSVFNMFSSPSN